MRFIMIVLTAVLVSCIAENEPFLIEEVKITPVSASEGSRFEYCAKVLSLTASELVIVFLFRRDITPLYSHCLRMENAE